MKNQEIFHQSIAMMTVWLNELAVAIDDGWFIPSVQIISIPNEELYVDLEQYAWSYWLEKYISRIFGAVMAAILLDKVGRKPLLSVCAITFNISWLILLFARSVSIYYTARIAIGIVGGIYEVSNAVYLGEISSPSVRSIFGTIIKTIYGLGFLIGFITVIYVHFKTAALINFFITLLSLISVFWMVEPVQYLLMKGKLDQAKKNFMWLKGVADSEDVIQEFEKIKQNVYAETSKKTFFIKIFTYPANYKSLLIMLTISSLLGLMNYNFESASLWLFLGTSAFYSSTEFIFYFFLGVTQFLVMALTPFIIRRFSRRSMIMLSFSLITATLILISALVVMQNNFLPYTFSASWIRYSILFFNCIHAFASVNLFLLRSELFPLSMKAIGGSICVVGYTLGGFLMTRIMILLIQHINFIFILFSVIGVILVLFFYCIKLPETENKPLIEIQEELEG